MGDEQIAVGSFGEWVRQRRRGLDLTQAKLAQQIGCAVVTIKKIEQDERQPSQQLVDLLAEHLKIPLALQDDFIRMGRGQYVPSFSPPAELDGPLEFLQRSRPTVQSDHDHCVARKRELDQLDTQLESALTGAGRIVFIAGEAGRGKTTLMAEFARRAQASHPNLVVASGHCNAQSGAGDPYLPFRDILQMVTGDLEARWAAGNLSKEEVLRLWALFPHTVRALVEDGPDLLDTIIPATPLMRRVTAAFPNRTAWLNQLQALVERQQSRVGKLEQHQLLEEVTQVLCSLAAPHPLLLLLDDLQWIDTASTELLFHLGRRVAGSRILVLGAYRPSEVALGRYDDDPSQRGQHPLAPIVRELERYHGDIRLDLEQLTAREQRDFVDALLDSEPNHLDEAFREHLFLHTRGHPLFTVEVLRNMEAEGLLVQDESGAWIEAASAVLTKLPVRVEAVIAQRLDRLAPPLRDLLIAASVEGELFTAQVAAHVLQVEERFVLRDLARELDQRHRLVHEHSAVVVNQQHLNRYRFAHMLFQEHLYRQLSQGERRLYHHLVAEALEALFEANNRGMVTALLAAPDRVGEVLDRPAPDWLAEFGPSLVHHAWHGEAWAKAAVYALCVGAGAMKAYALREAIKYFDRALQALVKLPDAPPELVYEANLRWVEAAFKFEPYPAQLRHLAAAETLARAHADQSRLIGALHWTANVYLARGLWMQAAPSLLECLALAQTLGNERLSVRPTYFKALMTTFSNPPAALPLLEEALVLTRKYGDRHIETLVLGNRAYTLALLGDFAGARATLDGAYHVLAATDSPLTASDVDLLAGWMYLAMGDLRLGLNRGERSVEKAIATDNMDCICYGYACVGFCNLELGEFVLAASAFAEAVARSEVSGAVIPKLLAQAGLAMAQFCRGRVEAIADLETSLAAMQEFRYDVGVATVQAMLGTCWSQIGDLEQAEHCLVAALDFYRRMEMRPYLVRNLSSLAALLQQQRPAEALAVQAELTAVQATFEVD